MMTDIPGRWWVRLVQFAALGTLALVGSIFDVPLEMLPYSSPERLVLISVQVGLAIAAAAVFLPIHQQGSKRLPQAALVVAVASLAVTAGVAVVDVHLYRTWGLAESLGLLGVIFVVARRGAAGWAPVAVTVTVIAVALLPLRGLGPDWVTFGLLQALGAAGAVAGGTYMRLLASSRERAVAALRVEQRAEFARDLHDFIAHHVTGIVVQAQGARFVAEQDPQRVLAALEQIEAAGLETMTSMRRMVGVLRNPNARPEVPLAPLPGITDMSRLLDSFRSATTTLVRPHIDGDLDGLPVEISTSAYRVVMEALTNARQHAPNAQAVDVLLRRTPDWLLVRVVNDGVTRQVPAGRGHGYGLIGLSERVSAVGGSITAGPDANGGWVVDAALPLHSQVTA